MVYIIATLYNLFWILSIYLTYKYFVKTLKSNTLSIVYLIGSVITCIVLFGLLIPGLVLQNNTVSAYEDAFYSGSELEYIKKVLREDSSPFYRGVGETSLNYIPIRIKEIDEEEVRCKSQEFDEGLYFDMDVVGLSYFLIPTTQRNICDYTR